MRFVPNQLKITFPAIVGWPFHGSTIFWKQSRTFHQLFRTSKEKVINIYFNGNSTISDNRRELILHDKNYKKKMLDQLSVLKKFRKEEEFSNLTRNHLSCNIFCILEKDKKTELLEMPLLAKEKEQNKLEVCVSKKSNEKAWVVDFVSDRPSGLSSPKAKQEGYLWISEKDLDCGERKELNHNHAESIVLHVLEQNKHLFIDLIEGQHKEITIKAFGIKLFSLIDSCQHCSEEVYNFLKKIRSPLHQLVKEKSFSLEYQSQKKLPFYVFFYSWRPYNLTEYTIVNSFDQQKSVCKILSNSGKSYSFENYSVTPAQNFLKEEELIANFKTVYSHIAIFEQSEQNKKFEGLEERCSNIIKKVNNLDLGIKEILDKVKSIKIDLEKTVKEAKQMSEQIKKIINEELETTKQEEKKLESKIEIPPK